MGPRSVGPTGYLRLYTEEPGANLIEINQRIGEGPSAPRGAWRLDHVGLEAYDPPLATAWFSDVLDAQVAEGRFVDERGHWLQLRDPIPPVGVTPRATSALP
jgi:hypothetical protein